MKRLPRYTAITIIAFLFSICAKAQAPDISYTPATNIYNVGTAITPLSPTNVGGSIPAATYATVSVYAGSTNGTSGRTNNSNLTSARFTGPRGLTIESDGTIYIADYSDNEIRAISSSGVTLLAGSTTAGTGRTNGTGTNARFNGPYAITHDNSGNLFVADYTNNEIREIDESTGSVTLFAGNTNGTAGRTNGTGSNARFSGPAGIVYDPVNDVFYVADYTNNEIRKITPTGDVTLFAGSTNGTSGSNDGTGTNARFNKPAAIAVDASGNVYVADQNNNKIRMITPAGVVTTFAGSGTSGSTDGTATAARFKTPQGLAVDISGNVYVSDTGNDLIRMITPAGVVTTVAGSGSANLTNGVGTAAEFDANRGIVYDPASGNLYVTDYNNNDIRKIIATGYTVSPDLPAGLSLNGATGVITGTPTTTSSATTYTITAFNLSGCSSTTISIACGETIYWRGTSNTRWDRANNWSTNAVPTANDAVEIGVSSTFTNQPAVSNADAVAYSITFGNKKDATLTISSGRTLTIGGGLTINTTVTPTLTGAGDVNMSPGSVITISGTGTLTINLSGNFTLQSDATGSASIAKLSSASAITGTGASAINVERYFTGGSNTYRGYRLVSSPVYQGTVSSNHVFNLDFLKASALITGGNGATGGFDRAGNPTLYLFRQDQAVSNATFTGGNYWGITAINNSPTYNLYLNGGTTNYNLPAGSGVLFFFRGDRTTNLANKYTTTTSAESVTFTSTGSLNMGQVIAKDWYTPTSQYLDSISVTGNSSVHGFNLVGNPYPSNIDWDTFQSSSSTTGIYGSNVSNSVYVLDPVSKNFGVYTAGDPSQSGTNGATNIIASGQGFFVKVAGTNPQLIFNESAKTSSQAIGPNLLLGKVVNYTNNQYLHLKMIKDAVNTDELMIRFDSRGSSNYIENMDAVYKQGYGAVSLSSLSLDKVKLAINVIPLPQQQAENIKLNVDATASGTYKLTLKDIVAIPNLYDVWMMDSYKNDSLDMRRNQYYAFDIDKSDSSSFGANRFTLIMRQNQAYAYKLLNFGAAKVPDTHQAQISWNTANEGNYTYFTVERSTNNGNSFEVLGGVTSAGAGSYSILDKNPVNGSNIYRLKQVDINNVTTYSKPSEVEFSDLGNKKIFINNLSIFPNPITNNTINLVIDTKSAENTSYKIRFMNSSGIIVKEVVSTQASWNGNLSNLQPGVYMVHVVNNKTNAAVGETKFVKL